MAHEIENNQFAYVGKPAWHGLGNELPEGANADDFLKAAGLDWDVIPANLKADIGDGQMIDVPGKKAFIRSSDKKLMTIASDGWTPFQNRQALQFMQQFATAGKASLDTAGALRDGQLVWGLLKLNHSFETRPGDKTEGFVLIVSPHTVGKAISVTTTTIRVVCQNTLSLADKQGKVNYRQNHLSEFNEAAARASIEAAHEQLFQNEKEMSAIDKLKLSIEDAVLKVFVPVFAPELEQEDDIMSILTDAKKMPKNIAGLIDCLDNAPGAIPDTGYGVLQAITNYCDHHGGNSQETRMFRSFAGDYRDKKIFAQKLLLEMSGYDASDMMQEALA